MKKLLFTFVTVAASVGVFAQGKVSFQTDSLHLVYYNPGLPAALGGGSLAGQPVSWNNMPNGVTLMADLYMGTSSSSLTLYTSETFSSPAPVQPPPGRWNIVNVETGTIGPSIPGGTTVFTVVQIRDSAFSAPSTWTPSAQPFSDYYGASSEFTFVLGPSIVYPALWSKGPVNGGGNSTWPDGTYNMDFLGSGSRGAIMVGVPEPSSLALAGLGAAMLLFRRRK